MKQQLAAGKDRRNDDTLKPPLAQPSPFPGGMPGHEDPIPAADGTHQVHGSPHDGNPSNFQNWMHEQAGAGGQVLGDIGIKDQMMQDINAEIHLENLNLGDQNVDMEDDNQLLMDMEEIWVPQHPDQPLDSIYFDQMYSTANNLRANKGPDIHLSVEEVLAAIENNLNNADPASADDSGMVTLERVATVTVPAYIIRACKKLPVDSVLPVPKVSEWKEDIQKAIVPVQPVLDCILLRLWVFLFGEHDSIQARAVGGPAPIPTVVSKRQRSKTPLVDMSVRRSLRLNPQADKGYQVVKVREPASKRRKKVGMRIDLDNPPSNAGEAVNPVPLENL